MLLRFCCAYSCLNSEVWNRFGTKNVTISFVFSNVFQPPLEQIWNKKAKNRTLRIKKALPGQNENR